MKYANVTMLGLAVVVVLYSLTVTYGSLTATATTTEPIEITKLTPSDIELPSLPQAGALERTPPPRRPGTARTIFGGSPGRQPAAPLQTEETQPSDPEPETRSATQESPQTPVRRPETNVINVGGGGGAATSSRARGTQPTATRSRSQQPGSSGGFAPAPPPFRPGDGVKRSGPESGSSTGRPAPPPVRGSMTRQRR